jgi:hypothetical protein
MTLSAPQASSVKMPVYSWPRAGDDGRSQQSCNGTDLEKGRDAMGRGSKSLIAIAALAGVLAFSSGVLAQTAPAENATPTADNAVMLTIFLKHDQSRPLSELNAQLDKQSYYKTFPPAGIEVVSWYVMMGIGQVVTLRLPASRLREVNRAIENTA